MRNSLAFRLIYYINNYLLSFNLLVGLFLTFKILSTIFGQNFNLSLNSTDHSQITISLSLISCVLCVIGLFMSFKSLDSVRLGKQIGQIDQKNFRVASILTTISGVLLLFRLQDSQPNSLLTITIKNLPPLTISWYGIFLLLIGQLFRFLGKK